jgi:membrane associated rhomboid family serine protease
MIFPLWVQGLAERPWPWVTTIIILINCAVFFATHAQIDRETRAMARYELPILLIAAAHPDAQPPADMKPLVDSFAQDQKQLWDSIRSGKQPPMNEWDREMRDWGAGQASDEMAQLAVQLRRAERDSPLKQYAFYPYRPSGTSFVTANFLHGGWLHLIFNMWFLWLAGAMMESVWGPAIYAGFYLLAGVTGLIAQATTYPHSVIPVLGASGAIAGLIGGFLVRFPHVKIDLLIVYFRIIRVAWPAVFVLPAWILLQVLWGSLARTGGGVAYWAHIGGFAFGMAMALALRMMGLERPMPRPVGQEFAG